ncbi:MAG: hypothetical protein ACN4GZ_15815 [Acidimicrobiales bacterium]
MRISNFTLNRKSIAILAVGAFCLVGLVGPSGVESAQFVPVSTDEIEAALFPQHAPDWEAERAAFVEIGLESGQLEPGESKVTQEIAFRQAALTQQCIAKRIPGAEFTAPKIVDGRVDWSMKATGASSNARNPKKPSSPSDDVYSASRDCHYEHMLAVERIMIADAAPKGASWFAMRDDFFACLRIPPNSKALAALAGQASEKAQTKLLECTQSHDAVFEMPMSGETE